MAGFRAGEKIEIRPGEARMEEMKELDRKVDPFLHSPLPMEGPGTTAFSEGTRSEGMKDFLAIGEKGATIDIKNNANLVRYEGKAQDEKPWDAKVQEALQDPKLTKVYPPEITGVRSLLENLAFYFKKAMGGWAGAWADR